MTPAPRPSELLGAALAACTGMDVISILRKKRQRVTAYEIRVSGHQMSERPHAFTRFDVVHVVDGIGVDREAVRRSIELSATKYCSVGSTLASGALDIRHSYLLRDAEGGEQRGDVVVLGPNEPYERAGLSSGRGGHLDDDAGHAQAVGQAGGLVGRQPWALERTVGLEEVRVTIAVGRRRTRTPRRSPPRAARDGP